MVRHGRLCVPRGTRDEEEAGLGEEGRRPCPQLRTGYVKQPGRPAGRCVRLTCPPPLCTGTKGVMPCLAPSKSQFFVPCHFRLPQDRVVHQPVALRPPSFWFVDSSPSNRSLFESNSFELVRGSFWKFEIERLWDGKGRKESMNDETTLIARPCSIIYCCTTWLSRFEILREGIRLLLLSLIFVLCFSRFSKYLAIRLLFSSLRDIFPYLRATLLQILSTKTIDAILFSKFEFDIYLITQFLFQQVIFEKFQKKRIERGWDFREHEDY